MEETQNLQERQTVLSKTRDVGPSQTNADVYDDLKSPNEYTPELEKLLLSPGDLSDRSAKSPTFILPSTAFIKTFDSIRSSGEFKVRKIK